FQEMTDLLKPLIIKQEGRDVFVKPKIVIEVAYEEIQKSEESLSGFSLRFPRFISLRSEKPLREINTIEDVKRIYSKQKGK
ncbi:MAG: DNA ligase, partial [Candidatus Nanoarchaeia archaeon]